MANFGTVESVTAVVARAILDIFDEGFRFVEAGQNSPDNFEVGLRSTGRDIENRAGLGVFEGQCDGPAVVFNEQPVTLLQAVTVDGKGLVFLGVGDHERNEFFGELIGAVIVGAAKNDGRDAVGIPISSDEVVGGCFACSIGTSWVEESFFGEAGPRRCAPVDFVGADLDEPQELVATGGFEEALGAEDVSTQEGRAVFDAAIDMGFGGEVYEGIQTGAKDFFNGSRVSDVAPDEFVTRILDDLREAFRIAGVGQLVKVNDFGVAAGVEQEPDEIRADETSTTRYQKFHTQSPLSILTAKKRITRGFLRGEPAHPGPVFCWRRFPRPCWWRGAGIRKCQRRSTSRREHCG